MVLRKLKSATALRHPGGTIHNDGGRLGKGRLRRLASLDWIGKKSRGAVDQLTTSPNEEQPLLPADILYAVAKELVLDTKKKTDLVNFTMTSRATYTLLLPLLYLDIQIPDRAACASLLMTWKNNPRLSEFPRSLELRALSNALGGPEEPLDEATIVGLLRDILAKGGLLRLECFTWHGSDMAPDDDLWNDLRCSCPLLNSIGTTVGSGMIRDDSRLFDFTSLVSFTMTLSFKSDLPSMLWNDPRTLPERLWVMLCERCPDLRHLSLFLHAGLFFDLRRILTCHFPRLTLLELGAIHTDTVIAQSTWHAFWARHKAITSLDIEPLEAPPDAFPQLREYCGCFRTMPNATNLTVLRCLSEEYAPVSEGHIIRVVGQMRHLKSFAFKFSMHDEGLKTFMNSLVHAIIIHGRYTLEELDLREGICVRPSKAKLNTLISALYPLHGLQCLSISGSARFINKPAFGIAKRLAFTHPHIRTFELSTYKVDTLLKVARFNFTVVSWIDKPNFGMRRQVVRVAGREGRQQGSGKAPKWSDMSELLTVEGNGSP